MWKLAVVSSLSLFSALLVSAGELEAARQLRCEKLLNDQSLASAITSKQQYGALEHYTQLENVIEILQTEKMELPKNLPREKIRSYNYTPDLIMFYLTKDMNPIGEGGYSGGMTNANYLMPKVFPLEDSAFTNLNQVYLRFSTEAMNGRDFHISRNAQAYGSYTEGIDFRSTRPKPSLEEFYAAGQVGEVGFYETIPMDFLLEIWVSPIRRTELISRMKEAGITEVNGKPIENIVKSPEISYNYVRLKNLSVPQEYQEKLDSMSTAFKWVIVAPETE